MITKLIFLLLIQCYSLQLRPDIESIVEYDRASPVSEHPTHIISNVEKDEEGLSKVAAIFLFVTGNIGVCTLLQTKAMGAMGFLFGLITLFWSGYSSAVCMWCYYDALLLLRKVGLDGRVTEMSAISKFLTGNVCLEKVIDVFWNFNLFFASTLLFTLFGEQMDLLYPINPHEYLGKVMWRVFASPLIFFVALKSKDMSSLGWAGILGQVFTLSMLTPVLVGSVMMIMGKLGDRPAAPDFIVNPADNLIDFIGSSVMFIYSFSALMIQPAIQEGLEKEEEMHSVTNWSRRKKF